MIKRWFLNSKRKKEFKKKASAMIDQYNLLKEILLKEIKEKIENWSNQKLPLSEIQRLVVSIIHQKLEKGISEEKRLILSSWMKIVFREKIALLEKRSFKNEDELFKAVEELFRTEVKIGIVIEEVIIEEIYKLGPGIIFLDKISVYIEPTLDKSFKKKIKKAFKKTQKDLKGIKVISIEITESWQEFVEKTKDHLVFIGLKESFVVLEELEKRIFELIKGGAKIKTNYLLEKICLNEEKWKEFERIIKNSKQEVIGEIGEFFLTKDNVEKLKTAVILRKYLTEYYLGQGPSYVAF